jgi:hypothetical protein
MNQFPASYLPVQSTPWGRAVERRIQDLETRAGQVVQQIHNGYSQVASSALALADTINGLVEVEQLSVTTTNFSVSTSFANKAFGTLAVPDGATTAIVVMCATVWAETVAGGGAGDKALYVRGAITGIGESIPSTSMEGRLLVSGGFSATSSIYTGTLNNPPSSGINIGTQARSQGGTAIYPTRAGNTASIQAIGIFLR